MIDRVDDRTIGRIYWAMLALGTCAMFAYLTSVGRWPFSPDGDVVITDFATVWAAGVRALEGLPSLVYDHPVHEAYYARLIGEPAASGLTFGYPPTALLLFARLGLLPYGTALLLYLLLGMTAWFIVLRHITRDWLTALAMALAWGGASQTILLGQNGFLTASLIGGGLLLLPRRPVLAGILFGVLAIKPHLGLALALFLLVRRDWRAIQAAVATLLAMVMATIVLWGPRLWLDFLAGSRKVADMVAERVDTIIAGKMQSAFALAVEQLPVAAALLVHAVFAVTALGLMVLVVHRAARFEIQAAAAIAATVLVTPYSFLYDCTMLTAAAGFLLAGPASRSERNAVLLAMALPGMWFFTAEPFVPLTGLLLLVLCLRQAPKEAGSRPPRVRDRLA
ncbi:glycosyltransferase family 87 protein [Altererythrobacter sp. H2]|uniref:glycosyltransferase family 87 protein n=1 Tax=Altererythrobacter sp. H2 TaxID=3108391 RepID=UPI002B4BCA53|nr:glycosyltransferase family 87 protein [Altererythrobacter sp. H2]WRK95895.1 glycosyltransferase family 87 protein [Altererythrobacter sp. H2]